MIQNFSSFKPTYNGMWLLKKMAVGMVVLFGLFMQAQMIDQNEIFLNQFDKETKSVSGQKLIPCVPFADVISVGGSTTVSGSVYPSLTEAIFDLSQCGITKAVVLSLNGDYNSNAETFPIVIPSIIGASAVNSITIKPASGVTKTISGNSTVAIFKLNGADFITIDGSNLPNGTSKNLSIINTNDTDLPAVIWIANTLTDGANNNTVKNTIITGNGGTTTAGNIVVGGSVLGTVAEIPSNNLTIINNILSKAQNAVFAFGNETTLAQNWNISNNIMGSSITADKGFRGISVQHVNNFTISKNSISGLSTEIAEIASGILIGGEAANGFVFNNKISDVKNASSLGYGSNGIFLNTKTLSANISVYNNMIWDVASVGSLNLFGADDNGYGMVVNQGSGYKIYDNTVNMTTNQTRGNSAAFNATINVTAPGAIDLRNNIFANNQTSNTRFAIYSRASEIVYSNINYNDYYSTGLLGFLKGSRTTLLNWQNATGNDLNSLNIAPTFISPSDLHIQACGSSALTGMPIFGIATDIDDEMRSSTVPDMGADEFESGIPMAVISVTHGSVCGSGQVTLEAVGSPGTTQYLWYTSATAENPVAVTTEGIFTTPELLTTTTFYVSASNGLCNGGTRIPVNAVVLEAPTEITIEQNAFPANATGCEVNYVRLDAVGAVIPDNILTENFNVLPVGFGNLPLGWSGINAFNAFQWGISSANGSGGLPNEVRLLHNAAGQHGNGSWVLNSPAINTQNLSSVKASFKYTLGFFAAGSFDLKLQSSTDNNVWIDRWAQTFTGIIGNEIFNNNPVAADIDLMVTESENIYLRWVLTGDSNQLNFFAMDDVLVKSEIQNPITWSPVNGLFTDSLLTIPYVNGSATNSVFAAPETETEYTASSTGNSCNSNSASSVTVSAKNIFTGNSVANTNYWNLAENWSENSLPSPDKCVIIPSGKTVIVNMSNAAAKSVKVESGGKLTISANQTLTVQDAIINQGNPADFTVASDGNLIQINPSKTINSGSITAERDIVNLRFMPGVNVDYIYWSSPVEGQLTKGSTGFSPGTPNNVFFEYRESNDRFYQTPDAVFVPGKGYAVRAEGNLGNTYSKTYRFSGLPVNGDVAIPVTRSANTGTDLEVVHGYNMVGNPYPSNINFDQLFAANSDLIYNAAWFWINSSYTQYQQGSSYSGNNYAVYNGTGGNPATSFSAVPAAVINPNGIIKVGQGFLVQKKDFSSGDLLFKNSYGEDRNLRVGTNGVFYYKNNTPKNRFNLQLIASDQSINSLLIGYVEGATDDFEKDYDAATSVLSSNLFYSSLNDKRLLIQGKSTFKVQDKVKLGVNFFQDGTYTISSVNREGIFGEQQNIYLKDSKSGIITNLSLGSYTFTSNLGEDNSRFEIVYESQTTLSADALSADEITVYRAGTDFVIKSAAKKITGVEMFDAVGRMIHQKLTNQKEVRIDSKSLSNGIYILKISQGEHVTTKKIIK